MRSLAKLRKEVEPVDTAAYTRLITGWQLVTKKRRGLEGLLEVIEALQGAAMPASILEIGDPRRAHRRLQAVRPRHAQRRRRDRLDRRRADRRARRSHRALPHRSSAAAARRVDGELSALEQRIVDHLRAQRRVVLRADSDRARRLRERRRRRALEPGLARRDHERHVPRAARLHAPEEGAANAGVPLAPRGAAVDARPLVAAPAAARHLPPNAPARSRINSWRATESSSARQRRSSRCRAVSAPSIPC